MSGAWRVWQDRGNGDAEAEKGSAQAAAQADSVFAVNEQERI